MTTHITPPGAPWSRHTASAARDHGMESLRAHARLCAKSRGRMFSLRCGLEAVHGFFAPRFVTTLALASVVLVLSQAI